jgi:hypothetical protein
MKNTAKSAVPTDGGWYVFAVEWSAPRQLNDEEENDVNQFWFVGRKTLASGTTARGQLDDHTNLRTCI